MANYGTTRNIEASLIDYIKIKLEEYEWRNVSVVKSFKQASESDLPVICVMVTDSFHKKTGLGERATRRDVIVHADVFAKSDGQRLDLKDFLIKILKISVPYNEYTIERGRVASKTYICEMYTKRIDDVKVNLGVDLSVLDVKDRYRHYIGLTLSLPKVEV